MLKRTDERKTLIYTAHDKTLRNLANKNQPHHPDRTACWMSRILRGAYPENT